MKSPAAVLLLVSAAAVLVAFPTSGRAQSYQEILKRFDYVASAPLDVRETGVETRSGVQVHDISYASPMGGRVPAFLVVPSSVEGRHPAAIWGHWYWGNSEFRNRREFLEEAVVLARSGLVSLLFDGPVARPGHYEDRHPLNEHQIDDRMQTLVDVRRAADLLLARPDVDPKRLTFVGHSYNASTGGYLAGIDKRFTAFVLMAGSLSDKVDIESKEYQAYRQRVGPEAFDAFIKKYAWLDPGLFVPHAAPAPVLMQFATREDFLTPERARQYAALVSEPRTVKFYDAPHALNAAARRDRIEFLQQRLGLKTINWKEVEMVPELPQPPDVPGLESHNCTAPDGVRIAYTTAGRGDTALLFIHGGFADRSFYDEQLEAFSTRYRVVALDLAGHGDSGRDRKTWGIPQFAADVKAVADAEHLNRIVLFGNSLGGPVAIEAALQMPGRVIGVVGIDTLRDLGVERSEEMKRRMVESFRQRAEALRKDYAGGVKTMVRELFHPDADPWVVAEAERRMVRDSTPEVAYGVLSEVGTYDYVAAARKLTVPLRLINGDLYPTDAAAIRRVIPGFEAVEMAHMGHYPMLERPEEFNRLVAKVVEGLAYR